MINAATIFSKLGNSNSLLPLAVKDMGGTAGMTAGSFITGKEEGVDRFIDEAGTEVIWLFGIPIYKWLFDKTAFKIAGIDSKFDPRILKDNAVFEKAKELSPNEEIKNSFEKISKKKGLLKGLVYSKFVVSTALTIASYILLTIGKQKYTENKIKKNLIKEHNEKIQQEEQNQKEQESKKQVIAESETNPAFKGFGSALDSFVFSPVKNMWILEGAITTTRLAGSRSPQELVGYSIKEAMTLMFLYYAGPKIQRILEDKFDKNHHKSIKLDARVLEGGELKKSFENGSVEKYIQEFEKASSSNTNLYEFLHKNSENMIVKTAKQTSSGKKNADIIEVLKNTNKIDTRKYIDLEEVKGVNENIKRLYNQYKEALSKGETSEKFFQGVKKLKRKSIVANIGVSILALGVITPGIMLAKRLISKEDSEFQTKKEIREQLIKDGVIA